MVVGGGGHTFAGGGWWWMVVMVVGHGGWWWVVVGGGIVQSNPYLKNVSYKVTSFYIFISEKSICESYHDNCFSLNPVYVFKKRRFCAAGKPKTVFAKLQIGRKKTKIF